ncbi:MAG: hypothetical protein IPJ65_09890 [Archangiaceae bacterium]|nr:hypothetical protein [Archangiaceae bacterium]
MKAKLLLCAIVLLLGAGGGAVFGLWWSNTTAESICDRLATECGESAMPMRDCLEGRQQDLLRYGVGALRKVNTCLAKAPHDCMSVSACLGESAPE